MSDPRPQEPTPTPAPTPAPSPTPTPDPAPEPQPDPAAAGPRGPFSEGDKQAEPTATEEPGFDVEKLKLPEGFNKGPAFEEFAKLAKENGWKHGVSQKAFDMHIAALQSQSEMIYKQWEDQQTEWLNEIKADPELKDIDLVKETVGRVLANQTLTDPEFRKALDFTGAGTHPAVVRTLFKWAQALGEAGAVAGSPSERDRNGGVSGRPDPARAIYGPAGPHTGGPRLS